MSERNLKAYNLAMSLKTEIKIEKQRVTLGLVDSFRDRLIRKVFLKGASTAYTPRARKRKQEMMGRDLR